MKQIEKQGYEVDINQLNLLRLVAIALVVLRHSFAPYVGSWKVSENYEYNIIADVIGSYISTISMPLFVFISGFLYAFLRNRLKKYPSYQILLRKKINRLLKPFIIFAPLFLLAFEEINDFTDFLDKLWRGPGHLWFLIMIFTVFLIYYPVENYIKKNIALSCFWVAILFALNPIFSILDLHPVAYALRYLPFFHMGYLFYLKNKEVIDFLDGKIYGLIFLHLLLFAFAFYWPLQFPDGRLEALFLNLQRLPLGIISIFMVYGLFQKLPTINLKWVNDINNNSYYIYLFHEPILLVFYSWSFLYKFSFLILVPLGFLLSFILSLLLSRLFLNFKIGRKIIGSD